MKSRPILFSGPMVRGLLAGTKTQTRRLLKDQSMLDRMPNRMTGPDDAGWLLNEDGMSWRYDALRDGEQVPQCGPYICPHGQPGDLLWVRETYGPAETPEGETSYAFRADNWTECPTNDGKWKPSIFMPRKASRITLEITDVAVERLSDISEADSIEEGVERYDSLSGAWKNYLFKTAHPKKSVPPTDKEHRILGYNSARDSYASLWEAINGAGSWAANPWVWKISFRVVTANTAALPLVS